ncbi:hypothetical protein [Rufibacter tibetensis]|uniref:Uncharacterized protein n=1 Tax=Rufibacter tibetensis TaxID=512763 RepID=A0A0P0CGK5_9BACT|nr:hypothetical protein [Rufibacter tibetensis]ALJ01067.1 hypothetical protein DC20_21300 [Rufibacter tibetensis]
MDRKKEFDMADLPKDPGFKVPEHYFDALPTRIMQRTAYASAQPTSATSWFWQIKTAVAGASLGVVFALSFLATQYFSPDSQPGVDIAQISQKEIYQYLVNHENLETADLAEVPAVKPRHSLEFLDVRNTDFNVEQTKELLDEEYDYR